MRATIDLVSTARVLPSAMARVGRATTSLGRSLRDDLFTFDVQVLPPLSRSGRFRWRYGDHEQAG